MLSIAVDDYFQLRLLQTAGWSSNPFQLNNPAGWVWRGRVVPRLGRVLALTDHEIEPPFAFGSEISLKCIEVTMFLPKEK